jgi:hypothetical protein
MFCKTNRGRNSMYVVKALNSMKLRYIWWYNDFCKIVKFVGFPLKIKRKGPGFLNLLQPHMCSTDVTLLIPHTS